MGRVWIASCQSCHALESSATSCCRHGMVLCSATSPVNAPAMGWSSLPVTNCAVDHVCENANVMGLDVRLESRYLLVKAVQGLGFRPISRSGCVHRYRQTV
jgi:hypothetical protein